MLRRYYGAGRGGRTESAEEFSSPVRVILLLCGLMLLKTHKRDGWPLTGRGKTKVKLWLFFDVLVFHRGGGGGRQIYAVVPSSWPALSPCPTSGALCCPEFNKLCCC
ncbi:hypothetical protein KUCAC02_034645 [Chaenocephalus aceratus]|nr:hypothetical protein KUCAC02_034645 [Chaenocephalus aceratus]